MPSILDNNLELFHKKYQKNKGNSFIKNTISNNPLDKVLINRDVLEKNNNTFSHSVDYSNKVTNQDHSGRCWLFAFTNLLRHKLIHKYGLEPTFELSQNYLFFYDKLEKSQYFLETMYKLRNRKIHSPEIKYLLKEPITDGGFWNMACNLVNKYGIIPKSNMQETFQSKNSKQLNFVLNQYLRRFSYYIRKLNFNRKQFNNFLKEKLYIIFRILIFFLGTPPKKFNWEYYTHKKKKGKKIKHVKQDITPVQFLKEYAEFDSNKYYIFVNLPMKSLPFYKKYRMKFCNNMVEGSDAEFINITINDFIKLSKKSIDINKPVWFGSDVHHYLDKISGIADRKLFDYDVFDTGKTDTDKTEELDKGDRILYNQSSPNHAMLILGYDYLNGKIDKWLIENSWGPKKGDQGYVSMDLEWFKEYVFEIVVEKKIVDKKIKTIIKDKEVTEILPWDVFSCEALCLN